MLPFGSFCFVYKGTNRPIDDLHISGLILNLYVDKQNGTQYSKSKGKDNEFELKKKLLIFETCKNSWDNFIANRKFTSCYKIKILNRLCGKIFIYIEFCMKWDIFVCLYDTTLNLSVTSVDFSGFLCQ